MLLCRPVRYQVGVGDQHARRVCVAFEHGHRLAGLHQQRFILFECAQRFEDGIERLPAARRLPAPAVHHQVLRALRYLRVQVILDHAVGGFNLPVSAG